MYAANAEAMEMLARAGVATALLAASAAGAPSDAAATAPTTLIVNALLIDGSGGAPLHNAAILVEGGRIATIADSRVFQAPPSARVIDAAGKTVVPGIVNLRGQVGLHHGPPPSPQLFAHNDILRQIETYASYGVTTTMSLAPPGSPLPEIRDAVAAGRLPSAARVLTPLQALSALSPPRNWPPDAAGLYTVMRTPEEARRQVGRLAAAGADLVQILVGSSGTPAARKVTQEAIAAAKRHGLRAAVQTRRVGTARAAVEARADFLTASLTDQEVDDAFIAALLASRTVYAPALGAEAAGFEFGDGVAWLEDRYLRRALPAGASGLLRGPVRTRQALDPDRALKLHRFGLAQRNLRKLAAAGVEIALASGSGVPGSFAGYAEYREAALLQRAGLAASAVIRAFSGGGAAALGLAADRGILQPGRRADLMILNANPLENIHHLRELHAVLVGGRLVRL